MTFDPNLYPAYLFVFLNPSIVGFFFLMIATPPYKHGPEPTWGHSGSDMDAARSSRRHRLGAVVRRKRHVCELSVFNLLQWGSVFTQVEERVSPVSFRDEILVKKQEKV